MKYPKTHYAAAILLAFAAYFFAGCQTTRDLDPEGVYQGDRVLFNADALALQVFDSIDSIQAFASRNPSIVAESESFQSLLSKLAENRQKWKDDYFAARDSYEAAKTLANRQQLDISLEVLRAVLTEIQARQ